MENRRVYMFTGNPKSGKSAAAAALMKYLGEDKVCYVSPAGMPLEVRNEFLNFRVDQWLMMDKMNPAEAKQYLIIDDPGYSVYDREFLMHKFAPYRADKEACTLKVCAVHMARPASFSFDHNTENPYKRSTLMHLMNIMQQPVFEEGFDFVYRVFGMSSFNPEDLQKFTET